MGAAFFQFVLLETDHHKEKPSLYFKNLLAQTQCLKIIEKVSFNIASEASYVCIFGVTRQVTFNRTKIGENAKIEIKCDILGHFQTLCHFSHSERA